MTHFALPPADRPIPVDTRATTHANTTPTKATVLIVDDETTNIEIMTAVLEDDFDVVSADSGEEALVTARAVLPDLVLLDVMMPGLDGMEVCRRLKQDPMLADVPIIFTTGLSETDDEMRGLSAGAIDYVTKPVQPDILRTRVRIHVEMKRARDQLARMAVTDALTGLSNRRHLERTLVREIDRLSRTEGWLSVILLDVDFFKQFNDLYGHPAGDRCLVMVAAALARATKRAKDLAARYGGEEFACVLPDTDPQGATELALHIQQQIELLNIPHDGSTVSNTLTLSIGIASARCRPEMSAEQWISLADRKLYDSKANGRNRMSAINF